MSVQLHGAILGGLPRCSERTQQARAVTCVTIFLMESRVSVAGKRLPGFH